MYSSHRNQLANVTNPDGMEMEYFVGGKLEIQWSVRDVAPESVRDIAACSCKLSGSVLEKCVC